MINYRKDSWNLWTKKSSGTPYKSSKSYIGDGEEKIPARLYWGHGCRHDALVVFVHGGGWVVGNVGSYDRLCRRFANRIQLPVVSIEYRLAPEHPFPSALKIILLKRLIFFFNFKNIFYVINCVFFVVG